LREDLAAGIAPRKASVVREHRPVFRSRFAVQNQNSAFAVIEFRITERDFLFEPCGHRVTVGPGMEGVQGEAGEKSFHLGVI
jgi:hypothetical protein